MREQRLLRETRMPEGQRVVQHVKHARAIAEIRIFKSAHPRRNGIRGHKAHPRNVLRDAVRIGLQNRNGVLAVPLDDAQGKGQ